MNDKKHIDRHNELHQKFDELFADYIAHNPDKSNFTKHPIMDLMEWSFKQTQGPDHDE
jgi:hypothetical protein